MRIEMPSKKGLILHTKNKYCNDDFEIVPTFDMSESDIVVKVNELPTTNIDKSKIYLVNDNVVGIPQNYIAYVYDNGWVSVAKIQEDYNLLDEQYKLLFKDYQILETNNTNLQNSYNNLQVENTTLQNNNSILQNENITLQNDKVVLQNQNTILNTQNNELQSSVDNLTVENTSLQSTINKLEEDVSYYQYKATNWENQYNFLMTDYESLSNDYSALEENYNVVSTEKEELKISNDKLAVQKDAFLGYIEGTKTELTAEDLDGLVNVRSYAFRSSGLTSIILPNTVKTLATNALRDTTSLQTLFLPNSITSISSYAFYNLKKLKNVTFEENSVLKSLPNYGFQVCSSLPKVILPNSITTIGAYTFSGCSALTFFEMGENIKSISDNAFTSCTALKTLIIKTVTPPSIYATSFKNVTFDAIYVPDQSVEAYKAKTNWSAFGDFIFPLSSYIPSEV